MTFCDVTSGFPSGVVKCLFSQAIICFACQKWVSFQLFSIWTLLMSLKFIFEFLLPWIWVDLSRWGQTWGWWGSGVGAGKGKYWKEKASKVQINKGWYLGQGYLAECKMKNGIFLKGLKNNTKLFSCFICILRTMPFCKLPLRGISAPFKVQLKIMMGEKNENHSIYPNFISRQ